MRRAPEALGVGRRASALRSSAISAGASSVPVSTSSATKSAPADSCSSAKMVRSMCMVCFNPVACMHAVQAASTSASTRIGLVR